MKVALSALAAMVLLAGGGGCHCCCPWFQPHDCTMNGCGPRFRFDRSRCPDTCDQCGNWTGAPPVAAQTKPWQEPIAEQRARAPQPFSLARCLGFCPPRQHNGMNSVLRQPAPSQRGYASHPESYDETPAYAYDDAEVERQTAQGYRIVPGSERIVKGSERVVRRSGRPTVARSADEPTFADDEVQEDEVQEEELPVAPMRGKTRRVASRRRVIQVEER